jgi:hypothetical protein
MLRRKSGAKPGTQAHLDELRAREIALGLIAPDAPAPPASAPAPAVDDAPDVDDEYVGEIAITRTDDEVVSAPDDEAQALFEIGQRVLQPHIAAPVDEKDGAGLLALLKASYLRPLPDRARVAELEAAYIDTAAYAAGIPFLTCRLFPSQSSMRDHHARWRLVYWRDNGETCCAWRCLKCYPELEAFGLTSARAVEVREIERRQESERDHAEAS